MMDAHCILSYPDLKGLKKITNGVVQGNTVKSLDAHCPMI